MGSLVKKKNELRKYYKKIRNEMSKNDVIKSSRKIKEKLLNLPVIIDADHIMLYYPINNEIDTNEMINKLLQMGKKIYLPYIIEAENEIKPGKINNLNSDLVKGRYGIMEPVDKKSSYLNKIEIVIVPGIAFSRKGDRLGYGGGYYDHFLSKLEEKVFTAALTYDFAVLDFLPTDNHDQQLKMIISDKNIYSSPSEV